ncbi:hypothetical protein JHK86_036933 [Glycine max]|nr:hypothetical protein JHK86_036933 [Glycine max]
MPATVTKVAALSGSLKKTSSHTGLIRAAIELSKGAIEGIEIEFIEISELPMLNTDLENNGTYPPIVEAFRCKILQAHSVLFASPEPPNVWAGKAAAIISAGYDDFGGGRAQYHLRQIGVYLDLHFINKPEFFLNSFQPPRKFNRGGDLIDEEAKNKLKQALLSLQEFTLGLISKG